MTLSVTYAYRLWTDEEIKTQGLSNLGVVAVLVPRRQALST